MPTIRTCLMAVAAAGALSLAAPASAAPGRSGAEPRPTIILVHGAFAGSSSWNRVMEELQSAGYTVIAEANPLRSVRTDSAYLADLVDSIPGPVVLVGHSYGGEVISTAGTGRANVKALVFVAGLAPEAGEGAGDLDKRFPGTLGQTLSTPVPALDGAKDVYIRPELFRQQFAADVPAPEARLMAANQRPVTQAALMDPAGPPAWRAIPSWFIYGELDKNIPARLHAFMAARAHAREAVEIKGASHVVMVSHPHEVAAMIERAAAAHP